MKKIYINSLIAFLSLNICAPAIASEKSWLNSKMAHYTHNMLNRHSYKALSFEHVARDLVLLCLPSTMALYILKQQRENMVNFLRNNEAAAKEDVRQYFNFDQQTWSDIMNETKEDHEFNLDAIKSTKNYKTYHDPSLPLKVITGIERECRRYGFNKNNFNLNATTDQIYSAGTSSYKPTIISGEKTYIPTNIFFNMTSRLLKALNTTNPSWLNKVLMHEMTHIAQGHSIENNNILQATQKRINNKNEHFHNILDQRKNILNSIDTSWLRWIQTWYEGGCGEEYEKLAKESRAALDEISILEKENKKLLNEFPNSPAGERYTAAREKTADTLVPCTDLEAAKNAANCARQELNGYPDNDNDLLVINNNWQMTKNIASARNFYQTFEKKGHAFISALRKCMPF